MANVIIIDQESRIHNSITSILEPMGHAVRAIPESENVLPNLKDLAPDLAILQAENGGMALLTEMRKAHPQVKVIVTVSSARKDLALQAFREGASDMLIKPLSVRDFVDSVNRCISTVSSADTGDGNSINGTTQKNTEDAFILPLIGTSKKAQTLRNIVESLKQDPMKLPMLIHGPAGSSKRDFAHFIHRICGDKNTEALYLDCAEADSAEIQQKLVDEKGAPGEWLTSDSSVTIILDHVDQMQEEVQDQLAGVAKEAMKDVLLICIADANVDEMLDNGTFSMGFYFRISAKNILFAPLAERTEDIEEMAKAILTRSPMVPEFCRTSELTTEVMQLLRNHPWPENYAELEQVITLAAMDAKGGKILPTNIKRKLRKATAR